MCQHALCLRFPAKLAAKIQVHQHSGKNNAQAEKEDVQGTNREDDTVRQW